MIPHNSWLVACRDVVVIVAVRNVAATGGVAAIVGGAAADGVLVVVGAVAMVVVWVQRCLTRPCTSLQFAFVLVVVTPTEKDLSWWDR